MNGVLVLLGERHFVVPCTCRMALIVPTLATFLFHHQIIRFLYFIHFPCPLDIGLLIAVIVKLPITFNLPLDPYYKNIYIDEGLKGLIRFSFSYSIGRVIVAIDPSDLIDFLSLIGLLYIYNVDYKPLFLRSTELYKILVKREGIYINNEGDICNT